MIAVVDCNNFYVSCEQLFNPTIRDKAVVVLSNNDGCAVSRSNEAKLIGVKMGQPWFEIQKEFKSRVTAFSANFALYADISDRIVSLLAEYTDKIEVYSIDEAFISFDHLSPQDAVHTAEEICARCLKEIGVPVSIGIANNKTLAKVAVETVKDYNKAWLKHGRPGENKLKGVLLINDRNRQSILEKVQVSDIWNVGRAYSKKLLDRNIQTAWMVASQSPNHIRTLFGNKMGYCLVSELNGELAYPIVTGVNAKKGITSSRSFAHTTSLKSDIAKALSRNCAAAGYKLRKEKLFANYISVFFSTHKFHDNRTYFFRSRPFDYSVQSDIEITDVALQLLDEIFEAGHEIKKAGITLTMLGTQQSNNLFVPSNSTIYAHLSHVTDKINTRYGASTIYLTSGMDKSGSWIPQSKLRSRRATTLWNELIEVK